MHNQQQKLKNTIAALNIIGRFGWARADGIGPHIWPKATEASSTRMAQRLTRRLVKEKLLIERKLPAQAGYAYVLSTSGARLARQHGATFQGNGKDWGSIKNGTWAPPREWVHDLWLQLAIIWIARNTPFGKVQRFWTEKELRSTAELQKIPDALFETADGEICWVELERARKSGAAQDLMVETVLRVLARRVKILGMVPSKALFIVPTDMLDLNGHKINHRQNIEEAFTRKTTTDILPVFMEFEQKGAAPINFRLGEKRVIESDAVSRRLALLESQMRDIEPHQGEAGATVWDLTVVERFFHSNRNEDEKFVDATICKLSETRCLLTVQETTIFSRASNKAPGVPVILGTVEATSLAATKRRLANVLVRWQDQL